MLLFSIFVFLLVVLTSDTSSVLNCPAWGLHYFHNWYFLGFIFILGYFSTRDMYFNTFLGTNTRGPLFSELLSDFFYHMTLLFYSYYVS